MMFGKALMRSDCVRRKAHHFRAGRGVIFPTVAHGTHLTGADGRLVAGIKQQHDDLASVIRETPLGAVTVAQREVRRGGSFLCRAGVCQSYFMTEARLAAAT